MSNWLSTTKFLCNEGVSSGIKFFENISKPPPRENISVTVNQFVIYDAYKKELKRRADAAAKDANKKPAAVNEPENVRKDYEKECLAQIRIIERIVNQNTFSDLADDFKEWFISCLSCQSSILRFQIKFMSFDLRENEIYFICGRQGSKFV